MIDGGKAYLAQTAKDAGLVWWITWTDKLHCAQWFKTRDQAVIRLAALLEAGFKDAAMFQAKPYGRGYDMVA